jgi:CRP/FNR family transcriptional regulator, cyclic AMP receptor protein
VCHGVERGGVNDILERAGILQGVTPDAAAALAGQLQPITFPRRRTVLREGKPGDQLYIIVTGKVKIRQTTAQGRETLITGPADIFGELALFDPDARSSTVTTLTKVQAVTVHRNTLRAWIIDHPEIAEQMLRVLTRRLRRTNNAVSDPVFTDVPGRLAKQLLDLVMRFGTADGEVLYVDHGLSQRNSLSSLAPHAKPSTRRSRTSPNADGSDNKARPCSSTSPPNLPAAPGSDTSGRCYADQRDDNTCGVHIGQPDAPMR